MPIYFRRASYGVVKELEGVIPDGYVIGLIGDAGAGQEELLALAAGQVSADSGVVEGAGAARCFGFELSGRDGMGRVAVARELEELRRRGGVGMVASHELGLVKWLCDEVWWLEEGSRVAKGDAGEICGRYEKALAERMRAAGAGAVWALPPAMRKGDGRAELEGIETVAQDGNVTAVWRTGEQVGVRVRVRFQAAVADPVIGILLRTRIGFEVYGTNTELEKVAVGPCAAGERREVEFRFVCQLCPGEYTLTAASHDADGVWHDWVEDGVALAVADERYTAGVVAMRAKVVCRVLPIEGDAG